MSQRDAVGLKFFCEIFSNTSAGCAIFHKVHSVLRQCG